MRSNRPSLRPACRIPALWRRNINYIASTTSASVSRNAAGKPGSLEGRYRSTNTKQVPMNFKVDDSIPCSSNEGTNRVSQARPYNTPYTRAQRGRIHRRKAQATAIANSLSPGSSSRGSLLWLSAQNNTAIRLARMPTERGNEATIQCNRDRLSSRRDYSYRREPVNGRRHSSATGV